MTSRTSRPRRSVDSNFVPAGAREPQLEGVDAARWKDLATEGHPDCYYDADGDDEVATTSRPRTGAIR